MSKQTDITRVPKLRFPEFRGEWDLTKLEDLIVFQNGKAHEQNIDESGDYVVVNSKLISSDESVKKFSLEKICKIKDKSIVMVMSDVPNGKALAKCLYLEDASLYTLNQRICSLSEKNANNKFLYYQINRNRYYLKFNNGVSQTNLRKQEVLNCPVNAPLLPEQTKIASFLSAVDKKISQLERKKELLEQYKKGCMQKFFSQEIRFKDENGNDFPDWEEKRLGDVATFLKGKGIAKADLVDDGKNPVIHYGQLFTVYSEYIENVVSRTNVGKEKSVLSLKNDVLMPTSDVTPSGLATTSAIDIADVILGGDVLIIRSDDFINSYFSYWVSANQHKIMRLVSGVTVYHIYGSDMATLRISFPSLPEQTQISDFLKKLDKKLREIGTEIQSSKAFKKGLLQQMFV